MAFMLLPIIAVLFFMGLTAQTTQVQAVAPGAGMSGHMQSAGEVRGQLAAVFAAACVDAAYAAPGVVTNSLPVTLPLGVVAPVGSGCITTAGPTGGRNVYAYVPRVPGALSQIAGDSGASATWYQVLVAGQATSFATGQQSAVPQIIPAGSLLEWVQTQN
jgi:hypothetical protein